MKNRLILNVMSVTRFNEVGRGICLLLCSMLPLTVPKYLGDHLLDFWERNIVPFSLRNSPGSSFHFTMLQMFQLMNGLDCRQVNSIPGLFHYEAVLF